MTDSTKFIKPIASDPRIFFAAERTLLAWVRSGLAIIAIGFVVAKSALLLELLTGQIPQKAISQFAVGHYLGFAILLSGVCIVALAQYNHSQFLKTLPLQDIPNQSIKFLPMLFTSLILFVGLMLASYLLIA